MSNVSIGMPKMIILSLFYDDLFVEADGLMPNGAFASASTSKSKLGHIYKPIIYLNIMYTSYVVKPTVV